MIKLPKTIFSRRLLSPSDSDQVGLVETKVDPLEEKKISYWLEKLFYQEREKMMVEKFISARFLKHSPEDIIPLIPNETPVEPKLQPATTLDNTFVNSNRTVLRILSIFPLDISPTIITVETIRVMIMHRQFFSSQIHSVDIKDISNVFIDSGFISSSITIVSRTFIENNVQVDHLKKRDAILIRNVIEGLRICEKEKIATSDFTVEELIDKFKELIPSHIP